MKEEIVEKKDWEKELDEFNKNELDCKLGDIGKTRVLKLKKFISDNFIAIKDLETNIGMLRQWLNEDKIDDVNKMITNENIEGWLLTKENKK